MKFIPALVCVIFCIILFSFHGPRGFLFRIASPLWSVKEGISTFFANNIQLLRSESSLIAENTALQNQINDDAENNFLMQDLTDENADLKSMLGRNTVNQKDILAAVLEKPFLSPYDTLVIDAGSAEGIVVNDPVLASSSIVIGFVSDVYENSSKVTLYSSSGEHVNVQVGAHALEMQAIGLGGGDFSINAPSGSTIAIGDPIIMPSIAPTVFGTVEEIQSKPSDSFETILFKDPVNISELRWVLVAPLVHTKTP